MVEPSEQPNHETQYHTSHNSRNFDPPKESFHEMPHQPKSNTSVPEEMEICMVSRIIN